MDKFIYDAWPALPYAQFKSTVHLLHMGAQMLGKLKLHTPFEPHWSNVALLLTSRGVTTGLIPFKGGTFSIDMDFIDHQIIFTTSWGKLQKFDLGNMSVAQLFKKIFAILQQLEIDISINPKPQEIPNPIAFNQDTQECQYDPTLANAWWRILLSSHRVMELYHSRFDGETPAIGLMWGGLDIREVRYNGVHVPTTGINASYIRRNAMNEAQVEIGWWAGNDAYPKAAYFSFTYPQPAKIEQAKIQPNFARWDKQLSLFILDYDDLRKSADPDKNLLNFFESTYAAGSVLAGWNPNLVTTGEPA